MAAAAAAGEGQGVFERRILDSMSSGVAGIDRGGRLRVFNAAAQRILGCPDGAAAAALGRDCREALAPQADVAALLLEALERREPLSRAELVLAERPGAAGTIGFTLGPVSDPCGAVCGAAMIFRDLSPIERRDEQARLRDRLAALGEMAAGLAHEIRNPLAGMEVLVGLLRRRAADRPEEQALLAELSGELRGLAETVTASLEYVRPVVPEPAPVDPERLLREALAIARARVPFAGEVEWSRAGGLPRLEADAEQLRAVFTNLLVNALEAMAEAAGPGRLRLGLAAVGAGELEISVGDDGPGVAPGLREKVFSPFFTTKPGGSGLGLATAQKIVASAGGRLELDPGEGPGCVLRVRLAGARSET